MFGLLSAVALLTSTLTQTLTMDATHYGYSYHGNRMGCPGAGTYNSYDPTIAAVGYNTWSCGTELLVEGSHGDLIVTVKDTCPGCGSKLIDLSEAGVQIVCGGVHTCRNVRVTPL